MKEGDLAPGFDLESTAGGRVSLAALRGKPVVLYFYPKDDTPGCTQEACDFRDGYGVLRGAGVEVYGVSKDSLASHERFRGKYSLPFPLLSDPDNSVAKAYGAFGQKLMYGKPVIGTIRSTFLIDAQGKLSKIWSPVRVAGHAAKVMEALGLDVPAALRAAEGASSPKKGGKGPAKKGAAVRKSGAKKVTGKKRAAKKVAPKSKKAGSGKKGAAKKKR